ncbi:MAG: hypothetical protein ACO3HV_10085 [Candidatus Nanopelagicales bacterium]
MTLLLLLTSSGGPKPVVAEINVISDVDAAATLNPPAQAAAAVTAIAGLDALLRVATDRAAEVIYAVSDVTATLTNSTLRPSATVAATASAAADPEVRAADLAAALIPAVASLAGSVQLRTVRASALIPGLAEVYIRIPARSLGGVASAGPGRSATGSMTGSGRGVAGTATSASGR